MRFTIGYISHNEDVFNECLGKSLKDLRGEYDIITTTDEKYPAHNYNTIIDKSPNDWVILTHQDISFSPDLLENIERTIKFLRDNQKGIGALGLVGRDKHNKGYAVHWSKQNVVYELETCDCCFIVFDKTNGIRFDEDIFDDYHLYVEDYCMEASKSGGIYSILTNGAEASLVDNSQLPTTYVLHHSKTLGERGTMWGRYREYKQKLNIKWGVDVKTT